MLLLCYIRCVLPTILSEQGGAYVISQFMPYCYSVCDEGVYCLEFNIDDIFQSLDTL